MQPAFCHLADGSFRDVVEPGGGWGEQIIVSTGWSSDGGLLTADNIVVHLREDQAERGTLVPTLTFRA